MSAAIERGDRVVTPRGDTARVLRVDPDGRLELEYEGALSSREDARLSLPASICRKIVPGRGEPLPVRRPFEAGA